MTISSSLNAGVAGLNANAARLATISDNIANSATYGYKRNTVDFHAMVVDSANAGKYSAGGVRTTALRLIDDRGPLVRTDSATDLSVDGRGFLPVTSLASLAGDGSPTQMQLVTTGSFKADADGYLTTPAGQVLMGWPAAADGSIGTQTREALTGLEPIRLNMNQFTANPTTAIGLSVNLPATSTLAGADGAGQEVAMQYFDNLGLSQTLTFSFTPSVPASGASNSWTLSVHDSASDTMIGEYTMTFEDSQTGGGLLQSVTTTSGGAYDPTTGTMELTVASGPIALTIGKPGQLDGMTQLSSAFSPGTQTKNGTPVASMISVEFDADGNLYGVYDQGFTRKLYQVPVADVRNPNGLTAVGNQAYEVSLASGGFYLWDAGDGPTGAMSPYSREESATDVATELTQLIQTQRAYSSNAKIIQTVDEMLQETTNLKR
ncbi:MAG: flagellar hook-basal body complex protein [Rhodobacterales bacterium]|nr:flagellar hook-basal body complex protein [Rhodobacterales bacterium]MDX5498465.1 flagellar hook-basal body complex protein [Rhodobacterales bacterium]